jgi:hypothetical protein
MIYTELRKNFFDLLCRNSSPDFIAYLRAYEALPMPFQESLDVSCELINGTRADSMRLAITGLQRRDVLRWLSACHRKIPLIQSLLFENSTDECFGIGLADYPSGMGVCRMKIYNTYGRFQSQDKKVKHIQHLFSLLNIPDVEFRKDLERFKDVDESGVDWELEGGAVLKVYFGPFHRDRLLDSSFGSLPKEEIQYYNILRSKNFLPETFTFSVKYSQNGRFLRTDLHYQTREFVLCFRMFDLKREALKFFVDFYRIFPSLRLQSISLQLVPVQKTYFYFKMR